MEYMSNTQAEVPPSLSSGGTQMSDLQMTKLCADAMGLSVIDKGYVFIMNKPGPWEGYNPFNDDSQAMALVKKCGLVIGRTPLQWAVTYKEMDWDLSRDAIRTPWIYNRDLNRAIVECVAKMQVDRTAREASAEATNK